MKHIFLLFILISGFSFAFGQNEEAPVVEKEIKYKDWTYKSIADAKEVNLREFTNGKKLVLVVYFAPWCENWRHQAPITQRLYDKYKSNGLGVIGVGEYGTIEEMKTSVADKKITFPVVYESDSRLAKQKTAHYEYRKTTGDTRGWGSPWNIFLIPGELPKKGDTLTKKAFVVNGELIEADAEKFIRERLGLAKMDGKKAENKVIEACDETKATTFRVAKP